MKCVAPQPRQHWKNCLEPMTDEMVINTFHQADKGRDRWRRLSRRHHHDWTIYRNCCIREMRHRGIPIPTL